MTSAAIYFHPDGYDTGQERLMGRQAAGEGFLRGYLTYSRQERLYACVDQVRDAERFKSFCHRLAGGETEKPLSAVLSHDHAALAKLGHLMLPAPSLSAYAWRRRRLADSAYSITGVTHTTASSGAMAEIGNLLTAPVQPWDALICTSSSVRSTVDHILDRYGSYLSQRFGGQPPPRPQLPVIPLGVMTADFDPPPEVRETTRRKWRDRLGIAESDIAILYVGRLSFHAKAHPLPMLIALEETAGSVPSGPDGEPGKLHLIQAGWFANDAIRKAFEEANAHMAPSVQHHILDGRQSDIRREIWFAGDIFCSLSDNIQETFGLTPVEAMAAGLPVVATDWDGYRDTLVPGETALMVPTFMPPPSLGLSIAEDFEAGVLTYDHYCSRTSTASGADIRACRDAFAALIKQPGLRARLGEAGKTRARTDYDWAVVISRYEALWDELDSLRREAAPALSDTAATRIASVNPLFDNPVLLFADYATLAVTDATAVRPAKFPEETVRRATRLTMTNTGTAETKSSPFTQAIYTTVRQAIAPMTLAEILERHDDKPRSAVMSAIMWLLKIGALEIADPAMQKPIGLEGGSGD